MSRSRRKANSPPYEDEHLSSDSSVDSGDDQYDTDPTEPDCEDDQLKDAGDVAQLFADNEHLPEYYLQQLEQFDESVYTQEDYSKGTVLCLSLTKLKRDGISALHSLVGNPSTPRLSIHYD